MIIRKPEELAALRHANRATTRLLREIEAYAAPGMTTKQLDDYARQYIRRLGGDPVFETEAGFPGAINANPNDVVVHGVPGPYVLKDGDLLTIDTGILLDGYVGDAASTFVVGISTPRHERLIATTKLAMENAIAAARTGNRVGDVSWAMQRTAEERGCSVARGFTGHGLGTRMWEEPMVPFAGEPGTGSKLREGMVLTVEPVVIEGDHHYSMANQWEARTIDGSWVAQFERAIDGSWVAQFERAIMVSKQGGGIISGD